MENLYIKLCYSFIKVVFFFEEVSLEIIKLINVTFIFGCQRKCLNRRIIIYSANAIVRQVHEEMDEKESRVIYEASDSNTISGLQSCKEAQSC